MIDLNRHPESKPLYTDGRIITGLCPTTNFLGNNLYHDHRTELTPTEINHRLEKYYWPYHHELQNQLQSLKEKFGKKPDIFDSNMKVLQAGYNFGDTTETFGTTYKVEKAKMPAGEALLYVGEVKKVGVAGRGHEIVDKYEEERVPEELSESSVSPNGARESCAQRCDAQS